MSRSRFGFGFGFGFRCKFRLHGGRLLLLLLGPLVFVVLLFSALAHVGEEQGEQYLRTRRKRRSSEPTRSIKHAQSVRTHCMRLTTTSPAHKKIQPICNLQIAPPSFFDLAAYAHVVAHDLGLLDLQITIKCCWRLEQCARTKTHTVAKSLPIASRFIRHGQADSLRKRDDNVIVTQTTAQNLGRQ